MRDKNHFEYSVLILIVAGGVFAFIQNNLPLQMLTIFVFGIVAASLKRVQKADLNFPYFFLIAGFLLGYLIATKTGFRLILLVFFFFGLAVGVHFKKYIAKYADI